jgi:hypothetical protein
MPATLVSALSEAVSRAPTGSAGVSPAGRAEGWEKKRKKSRREKKRKKKKPAGRRRSQ